MKRTKYNLMKNFILLLCITFTSYNVCAQQFIKNINLPSPFIENNEKHEAKLTNKTFSESVTQNSIRSSSQNSQSTIIFSEDFSNGMGQFSSTTISNVQWEYTTTGHSGPYPTDPIQSSTSANGWMMIDSDANGQSGVQEYSELISPVIDCSSHSSVLLQFEQMFKKWQSDTCFVMTSTDGGSTWNWKYYINSYIDANGYWTPLYGTNDQTSNPDLVQLDLTGDLGGQSQARFKFVWYGAYDYGWQIDDVVLSTMPDNDLELYGFYLNMSSNAGAISGYRDFYGHVPANQVTDAIYAFGVYNFGAADQTNVTTSISTTGWNDSENFGGLWSGADFVTNHTNQYMPTTNGQHDFIFSVSSDSIDATPANNEGVMTVFITDSIFTPFGTGEVLGSMGTGFFNIGGGDGFKMANMYELETADELTSVTLGLRTNGATQPGALVQVTVFDTTGFFSAGTETPIIYSNFYTITADDTTSGFATIPIPTNYNGSAQDRNLAPGAYFVSIECYNSGGTYNIVILDDKTVTRGPWSSMIYLAGDQWYTNGEAFYITANFGNNNPCNTNTTYSTSDITSCDTLYWNGIVCDSTGTYTYTLTNSAGCDSIATLNFTLNSVTLSNTDLSSCDTLSWNGTTYDTSGTYTFTTTNSNGCDSIASLNLTINNPSFFSEVFESCDNSYLWNGTTYNSSGVYYYNTINSVGCDSTVMLELTFFSNTNMCNIIGDGSVNTLSTETYVVSQNPGSTYSWGFSNNAGNIISGQTTNSIDVVWGSVATTDIIYCVETDNNGCLGDTCTFNVTITDPITNTEMLEYNTITNIFPNPTNDIINIVSKNFKKQKLSLKISNLLGEIVYYKNLGEINGEFKHSLDISSLFDGVYIVELESNNGILSRNRILKNK